MVDEKTRILREEKKKRMKKGGLKHFDQDPKKKRVRTFPK